MADRICHLCGTSYNDDSYFKEQPSHTPQQCLEILQYRYNQAELEFREVERQFVRAKLSYTTSGKKKQL